MVEEEEGEDDDEVEEEGTINLMVLAPGQLYKQANALNVLIKTIIHHLMCPSHLIHSISVASCLRHSFPSVDGFRYELCLPVCVSKYFICRISVSFSNIFFFHV